ncbi:MAG: hypothetical protein Fur0037_09180 [Planctomycetota bacterium]
MKAIETRKPQFDGLDYWHEAIDLAGLHACRGLIDLDQELTYKLVRLFPGNDAAVLLADDAGGFRVRIALGRGCPLETGRRVAEGAWSGPDLARFPIRFHDHHLGDFLIRCEPNEDEERFLTAILAHYAVALVNLTLNEESRVSTDRYCANLQALEEGIVLFQESDQDAVLARLLGLATSILQAAAGALYTLPEVGDLDSGLEISQTLGIPETLLQSFRGIDGDWPKNLLDHPPRNFDREVDPTLGGLDPATVPDILRNVVTLPLSYHGVTAGLFVIFNVLTDHSSLEDQLARVQSLGQLGAALLHRFALERQAVRTRALARELQIAEAIQERLLPQTAPDVQGYDFAWRSIAAQHIGGDYLDLMTDAEGRVHALIADASGHGINSALLMSSFRSTYRAEARSRDPRELIGLLNREVSSEVGATGMFITAAALRFEPDTGRLLTTNAGHNPLILYRAASGTVEMIDSHGPPLGFLRVAEFEQQELLLQPDDVLLLYTDGVTEALGKSLEMFGEENLIRSLKAHVSGSAAEIRDAILRDLEAYTGRTSQDDDVSISVIKRS